MRLTRALPTRAVALPIGHTSVHAIYLIEIAWQRVQSVPVHLAKVGAWLGQILLPIAKTKYK